MLMPGRQNYVWSTLDGLFWLDMYVLSKFLHDIIDFFPKYPVPPPIER